MRILKNGKFVAALMLSLIAIFGLTLWLDKSPERKPTSYSASENPEDLKEFKRLLIESIRTASYSEDASVFMSMPPNICQDFDRFEMTLQADGVAINGEHVMMADSKTCLDIASEALEMEWTFDRETAEDQVDGSFEWVIHSIEFSSSKGPQKLRITGYEVISVFGTPPAIQF